MFDVTLLVDVDVLLLVFVAVLFMVVLLVFRLVLVLLLVVVFTLLLLLVFTLVLLEVTVDVVVVVLVMLESSPNATLVTIPKAIPIMAYSRNLCITSISYCDFIIVNLMLLFEPVLLYRLDNLHLSPLILCL